MWWVPSRMWGVLTRPHNLAVAHEEVHSAQPKSVACGVEQAILHKDVPRVKAGDAVVPALERASLDAHVRAVVDVEAVMSAEDRDTIKPHVRARVDLVAPVCGLLNV
jgi:hypothetical protein